MAGCGSSGISIGVPFGIFCGGTELNVTRRIGSWESVHCAGRRSLGSNSMMVGLGSSIVVSVALFVRSTLIWVVLNADLHAVHSCVPFLLLGIAEGAFVSALW